MLFFSRDIIVFVLEIKTEKLLYSILDQLIRSETSIGANVVEGSSGSTRKDFLQFYRVALKSANETKYWLCLLRDSVKDIDIIKINDFIREADELSKIIAQIILNASKNNKTSNSISPVK